MTLLPLMYSVATLRCSVLFVKRVYRDFLEKTETYAQLPTVLASLRRRDYPVAFKKTRRHWGKTLEWLQAFQRSMENDGSFPTGVLSVPGAGLGLFATRDLPVGEYRALTGCAHYITKEQRESLRKMGKDDSVIASPHRNREYLLTGALMFVNHQCRGSSGQLASTVSEEFAADRKRCRAENYLELPQPVKAGEEIFVSYAQDWAAEENGKCKNERCCP